MTFLCYFQWQGANRKEVVEFTNLPIKNRILLYVCNSNESRVTYSKYICVVDQCLFLLYIITRKMVPIPRRASSFLVVVFIHVNRKEEEEGETEQQQQFTKGCNILHRLQVHHLTLTFIIHNKYTSTLYTYMHIPIYYDCSNNNAFY